MENEQPEVDVTQPVTITDHTVGTTHWKTCRQCGTLFVIRQEGAQVNGYCGDSCRHEATAPWDTPGYDRPEPNDAPEPRG